MIETIIKCLTRLHLKKQKNPVGRVLIIASYYVYKKLRDILAKRDNKIASKLYLRARNLERNIKGIKWSFATIDELLRWSTEWIKTFPTSYDVIVGIPRSGLLVANIIASKLGKPLTTPELFSRGQYWVSKLIDKKREYKNILLVDDSIDSGKTMEKSFQFLRSYSENLNITKAGLIVKENSKKLVDLYYKVIPQPRVFEWNLLHQAKIGKLATDLDGVICENCPPGVDLDEELYTKWIKNAKPYLIPAFEINVIVSNRLEKYRSDTKKWLANYGVHYKKLILWDIQSKQERGGKYAQRKIEVLLKIKPDIFWESSFTQAKQIWKITKIPTLCIEEMTLFT